LWQAIENGADSVEALADLLTAEYEVERETAVQDINEFVAYLAQQGVLVV
jgi:hypothetical protein